ncbi:hypothetical protein FZI85_24920 [Mycobacterium sp. CBMA293]|uniref:hypothetical protein n=1 Tax=unclassified Mycolicibacterium TaxID=2636767 RepID=UPI0012DF544B|nr:MULTISPECIES: hypothetical protein [unclassified Mycolicibacterium]MUL50026.1 hypothetical protein [Mycolicibacterium sp. CBMA 360]MUL61918.1 hypothetical protein [Mycolicibacterium sp. CBMA 335]MUL72597.1 hypothetical protein [Mycolicibacterium sp. CBMA 311]MUL92792.1 hypothetical protein [Mycolicibacterium sp. CBMA 230]MUM08766.1 hypothetical protein [Mycolicibacterium sp. CBMA 213]
MKRRWVVRVAACAFGVLGVTATDGVASALPDPSVPIVPSIIDQLVTSTPALSVDQGDAGEAVPRSGGVGMICQNLNVRCR